MLVYNFLFYGYEWSIFSVKKGEPGEPFTQNFIEPPPYLYPTEFYTQYQTNFISISLLSIT